MCDAWANEFEVKYAAAAARGVKLGSGLTKAGIELFRALPGASERSVLLCTDLHPENVLAARREPWLIIDPKPYVGDPTYDALQYMLNFPGRLAADPSGFVRGWPIFSTSTASGCATGSSPVHTGVPRPTAPARLGACPCAVTLPTSDRRSRETGIAERTCRSLIAANGNRHTAGPGRSCLEV